MKNNKEEHMEKVEDHMQRVDTSHAEAQKHECKGHCKDKNNGKKDDCKGDCSTDEKIAELTDILKRVQAEFENYKKRTEKEQQTLVKYAEGHVIAKLLPIVDTFELAMKNTQDPEKFKKGMELIYAELLGTLKDRGLMRISCVGKPFDPYMHEVMLTEESDKDEIILEELQPGYLFEGQVLRHAKVKIGKKGNNANK